MRWNLVIPGVAIAGAGFTFIYFQVGGIIAASLGILSAILGAATTKPAGVSPQGGETGAVKLLVDKGVFRTSIYQLMFLDKKLVLKRLASPNVTVVLALGLALLGFFLEFPALLGALAGGLAGYSIQEYLTQRNRDRISRADSQTSLGPHDLEFPYHGFTKVVIRKNRLTLFSKEGVARINLPRGYGQKIRPHLEAIFPGVYESEGLVATRQAPQEENQ